MTETEETPKPIPLEEMAYAYCVIETREVRYVPIYRLVSPHNGGLNMAKKGKPKPKPMPKPGGGMGY